MLTILGLLATIIVLMIYSQSRNMLSAKKCLKRFKQSTEEIHFAILLPVCGRPHYLNRVISGLSKTNT